MRSLLSREDLEKIEANQARSGLSRAFVKKAVRIWVTMSEHLPREPRWAGLFVDEAQDLSEEICAFLAAVRDKYLMDGGAVAAFGDPTQAIYQFFHKRRHSHGLFDHPDILLGDSFEHIQLTKCHRMSRELQCFANGFARKAYENPTLYDPEEAPAGVLPKIFGCQNLGDLIERTKEHVNGISADSGERSMTVLARTHREVSRAQSSLSHLRGVQFSTIHAYKGSEDDHIIIFHQAFLDADDDEADLNVWNVAITRARKGLCILSTRPYSELIRLFAEGTFEGVNHQSEVLRPTGLARTLSRDALTLANASASVIDSLELRIPIDRVPFLRGDGISLYSNSRYVRKEKRSFDFCGRTFPFVLQRARNELTFDFHDLTEFKRFGLSDTEIIDACRTAVQGYCHNRLCASEIDAIRVSRIDLARYLRLPTAMELRRARNLLETIFKISKGRKVENFKGTVYLNQAGARAGRKKADRGLRVYESTTKQNGNRIVDAEHVLKLESFRRNLQGVTLGALSMLAAEPEALEGELQRELEHSMTFLREKAPKNPALLLGRMREAHGIDSLCAALDFVEGKPGRGKREAHRLFWTLLELEEHCLVEEVLKILGLQHGKGVSWSITEQCPDTTTGTRLSEWDLSVKVSKSCSIFARTQRSEDPISRKPPVPLPDDADGDQFSTVGSKPKIQTDPPGLSSQLNRKDG